MLKVCLLCVGSLKESYWKDACAEYEKRLGAYISLEIEQVRDEADGSDAVKKESERILGRLKPTDYVALLAIQGQTCDSLEFAGMVQGWETLGRRIVLIIGGSGGVSADVVDRADHKISFSKLTFPHQLMRVVLLEQLYRAERILKKQPYHK